MVPRRGVLSISAALLGLLLGSPAGAQIQGGGGLPGGEASGPRGEAVPLDEATGPGSGDQFGGVTGGRNRRGGTAGSPTRSPGGGGTPGDPDDSRLGPPLGASGAAGTESVPGRQGPLVGGPIGPAGMRYPAQSFQPGGSSGGRNPLRSRLEQTRQQVERPRFDPITLGPRSLLEVPATPEDPGPAGGLDLSGAIATLIRQNLDLIALQFEVPKAEADILTASLRNNPIVYADGQLVPYGHYSFARPGGGGGQPQYDVNFSYPIDITGKRRARIAVAERAKKVTEAQLQDSVRQLIDDLYTAYLNVLAARETLRYVEAYRAGIEAILRQAESDRDRARREAQETALREGRDSDEAESAEQAAEDAAEVIEPLRDQAAQARFQVRQAAQTLTRTRRELAQLLNLPAGTAESLPIRGRLREPYASPPPAEALVRIALESRPDLAAYQLGVSRADADARLARANRLSDVYLVYQPYTYQDNRAFGLKGTYSYAVGVNASVPLFNRNQGNIRRADWNARQTRAELASLRSRVVHEVEEAARDLELSREAVLELENRVLPASRRARDQAYEQYRQDPTKVSEYIDKQKDHNEVVQEYRNALVEHRQAMLRLNTTVGVRLLP